MKIPALLFSALLAAGFAAAPATFAAADAHAGGINWAKGDVDAAFAEARAQNKPLFLYWGAGWCPPCNQVKATIFNRQAFIERSRQFVAVYIDGDSPSAQKLGTRFKVRGYPSMVLFRPDGSEITRLPGEVDSAKYLQVLTLSMGAARPVKDTLAAALQKPASVKPDEWRMLAFYSWDTDEQTLVASKDLAPTLAALAKAAPPGDAAIRLQLNAVLAAGNAKPSLAFDKAAAAERLLKVLADARITRDNMDIFTNNADTLVQFSSETGTPQRSSLITAFTRALQKLADDTTLSRTDRLTALDAEASVARLSNAEGKLDAALAKTVQKNVDQADRATSDGYERQTVINAAAHALSSAGLLDDSDKLLKAELKRSHSPYYFMSSLGSNAKKRGDKAAAADWYEQAWDASKGPATRLQWGANYVNNLLELAPQDEARIEKALDKVLAELAETPDAFYERNRAALEKVGSKLLGWNSAGKHAASFTRLQARLDGICGKQPAADGQRAACQGVLDPKRSQS